jgi:hypothetical protein
LVEAKEGLVMDTSEVVKQGLALVGKEEKEQEQWLGSENRIVCVLNVASTLSHQKGLTTFSMDVTHIRVDTVRTARM